MRFPGWSDQRPARVRHGLRYDNANRVRLITDAKNGRRSLRMTLNGNLLTVTDAKSQTTTYTYDTMDRLATRKMR
ncbi:MAG: hypothetical protein U0361_22690 [Nitrospiraceae bacterium]